MISISDTSIPKENTLPMEDVVQLRLQEAAATLQSASEQVAPSVAAAARCMIAAVENGAKIVVVGNGGSAADAQHFAGELVGHFRRDGRRPLPVLALTTDSSVLTCVANDYSYDQVFARQISALCKSGDVLVAISTSGQSPNILAAAAAAREARVDIIALTGADGGELARMADVPIRVPSQDTQHTQECHTALVHVLSELVEDALVAAR